MKTIKLMALSALFATAALSGSGVCRAGQAAAEPSATPEAEEEKTGPFSGEVGMALTNAYILNGLVQDKDTFIAQPYLTLNFRLYEGEGFLNDASFTLPLWASIHDINIPRAQNGTRVSRLGTSSISVRVLASPSPRTGASRSATTFTPHREITSTPRIISVWRSNMMIQTLLGAFALHPHFYFQQELTKPRGTGV